MKYKFFILVLVVLIPSCKEQIELKPISNIKEYYSKTLTEDEINNWIEKDILLDSIPGISLKRVYDSLLPHYDVKDKSVIVAIIDTEIDINHEDLKDAIWVNKNEIPNNNIDDDNNGYVDDINGWNFLGNLKGDNIIYSNVECVRIIQKFEKEFQGKTIDNILTEQKQKFKIYHEAKQSYNKKLKSKKADQEYGNFLFYGYPKAKAAMKKLFKNETYTTKDLDSVYKKYKTKNSELANYAFFISDFIKYDLSQDWIANYKKNADQIIAKSYNLNYIDKQGIDDKPYDITYKNYGNPIVNNNINEFYHGSLVTGLIAAKRDNSIGINGISNHTKIMPIAISSNGSEHDKDIALAIHYAVDNGAKIINMSFGKEFSLERDWVFEAFKYAEKHNVLIVSSSGNSSYNLNTFNNYYPNDNVDNRKEVSSNFLLVGSTSFSLDESLLSYYSNYGNIDVDVFAPGEYIYTTLPNNEYKIDSGTSLASAVTSGVAALIFSYYPNLNPYEVKQIIMNSGLEYNINVKTPTKDDKNKTTPFNQLSKSGKIVNAYNALIMADSISKNKH